MRVTEVRGVVEDWIADRITGVDLGLPEYDDRLDVWRVALVARYNGREPVGEVRVANGEVVFSSDLELAAKRLRRANRAPPRASRKTSRLRFARYLRASFSATRPTCWPIIRLTPPSLSLRRRRISTPSPNAMKAKATRTIWACCGTCSRSAMTCFPRGASWSSTRVPSSSAERTARRRAAASRLRLTFMPSWTTSTSSSFDDIIWEKPEGAGWHLGRGRRFAADRQPLQYKAVTVTENVIVYRKRTGRLIDWNLRNHPDPDAVEASLIKDDYEKTNVWRIHPAHHKAHPSVFPDALAERVIRYYSFVGDMVLDPFAGTGTTGRVAGLLKRRFMMIEKSPAYFKVQAHDPRLLFHEPQICDYEFFAGTL